MNRWFGRITPERTRTELEREAHQLARRFRVLELQSKAVAERATLDAKHNGEMAMHYEQLAFRLSCNPSTFPNGETES